TGVDDPYEAPVDAEITLNTIKFTAEENAAKIIAMLEEVGYLSKVESKEEISQ
ncbi:MAG: hypothetical protein IBX69_11435, partial [Anaerolineales bacterium]|nr:hypothetical protein [Anaerolineales bacterium]